MQDSYVKEFFSNIVPAHQDAFGRRMAGRVIGWKRTDSGALGAIIVFPHLSGKYLYGIDPHNRMRTRFIRQV
ncbi:hypothetical protein [Agrobacterium tumefaciens]|uniref:hypothetical protein n=1 Tax=Agrobacterium tumefaciens TaxID=358 RepID=UPI0021D2A2F5|nr:hypothetical protein [Agrobacterium tumefaciens]UXS26943.1 hypothetical protein FY153_21010 [Agrobacterium tumefaciens]UXS54558.1 hypothetical protein FY148_17760 [Agrobacterium tumefaciens]UXS65469.1 hypothetical protein FY147_21435 [Agrobacterium tumefaciens]